jgi:hypothetical protein
LRPFAEVVAPAANVLPQIEERPFFLRQTAQKLCPLMKPAALRTAWAKGSKVFCQKAQRFSKDAPPTY